MRHASLFSGIGGFDLAAEWMGWTNEFHCEWNPFCQQTLKYYWPNAISYDDITKTDFSVHRGTIEILTGGFPCQPYSIAGKRKGKEDERHLWPEMLRAIREIQPTWVVGENVFGLINWNGWLVFHEVQAELEAEGYEVQPFVLPAVSVNAPHRRDRVWFVGRKEQSQPEYWKNGNNGYASNTENIRLQQSRKTRERRAGFKNCYIGDENDEYSNGERFEEFNSTEKPVEQAKKRSFRLIENWDNWPTQSPVCDGDDGLPSQLDGVTFSKWKNESIKAAGNAIVPQVALQIFKAIEAYERIYTNKII